MISELKFDRVSLFLASHIRAFLFALGDMLRTPLSTLVTVIVIGVAMSLPAALYLFLQNIEKINHHWNGTARVSLYLKPSLSVNDTNTILHELGGRTELSHISYISPEQGLAEFEKATNLSGALSLLKQNPLPGVIIITPAEHYQSPSQLESLIDSLKSIPNVDNAQFDLTWVKRLYYLIQIAERISYALTILFSFGVVLIVGNTIRLITQSNRQEITVLRLIGATHAFIRRPLLYRGILYGLWGAVVALVLVEVLLWWLREPIASLAQSYQSELSLRGFGLINTLGVLVICSLLGLIGSWFSVNKQLRSQETL